MRVGLRLPSSRITRPKVTPARTSVAWTTFHRGIVGPGSRPPVNEDPGQVEQPGSQDRNDDREQNERDRQAHHDAAGFGGDRFLTLRDLALEADELRQAADRLVDSARLGRDRLDRELLGGWQAR
jgi:hypothetical protein